ncbi:hypothetical protein B566_EDAN004255 [Ephemera danica]|nr:hypothetical protein B566_EDAN004255 [Ephemera danica]
MAQCITNDRLSEEARLAANAGTETGAASPAELRRRSHHGSRTSFSSLGDTARADQGGSCESLPAGRPGVAGSVPGLLDVLSSIGGDEALEGSLWPPPSVPHVVATCCRHIMQHGLHTLGIFRVSSSKKRVRQLREDFDSGRDTEMDSELCPHDAATLLKEFFRDLPEPLMSRDLYPAFVQTQKIRNRRLQFEALQHLVQLLPVANRDTLATLLAFLNAVARHSADRRDDSGEWLLGNKMDSANLATLFAPNILHAFPPGSGAKEAAAERAEDRTDAINVTRSLIDHHAEIFEVSAELLDEVYLHMMDSHPDALDQLLRKLCFGGDENWAEQGRKVWSREEFLHETAGMGGPDVGMSPRHRGRERSKKRGKEEPSESTSSSRWFGHQSSKKREKSSAEDGRRRSERESTSSTGAPSESATPLSSPPAATSYSSSRSPSVDESQASTIIAVGGREERSRGDNSSGNVITASLKIPVPTSSFALSLEDIPYIEDDRATSSGRRSVDSMPSSLHTARPSTDSAIGSTMSPAPGSEAPLSASGLSSPPSIPATPTPGDESPHPDDAGMTTTGRILIPAMSSTKMTSTTVVRRVEVTTKSSTTEVTIERRPSAKVTKEDKKKYTRRRYTDSRHPTVQFPDVAALESAAAAPARPITESAPSTKPSQVWKRRELIASDPKEHETFV